MKEAILFSIIFLLISYLTLDEMSKSGFNAFQKQYGQEINQWKK